MTHLLITGSSGATDVTKNLKLSNISKVSQVLLVANKFRLITNVEGLDVGILCYNEIWRSI